MLYKVLQMLVAPTIVASITVGCLNYYYLPRQEAKETYARSDMVEQKISEARANSETQLAQLKERILGETTTIRAQISTSATTTDAKYITQRLDRIDSNLVEIRSLVVGHISAQQNNEKDKP